VTSHDDYRQEPRSDTAQVGDEEGVKTNYLPCWPANQPITPYPRAYLFPPICTLRAVHLWKRIYPAVEKHPKLQKVGEDTSNKQSFHSLNSLDLRTADDLKLNLPGKQVSE
jgi:hypothetical protein